MRMPAVGVDATSASEISQRYNVIVHSISSPGIGGTGTRVFGPRRWVSLV